MKTYLGSYPEPEVMVCYVAGVHPATSQVVPTEIEYAKLLELTEGVDQFTVSIST